MSNHIETKISLISLTGQSLPLKDQEVGDLLELINPSIISEPGTEFEDKSIYNNHNITCFGNHASVQIEPLQKISTILPSYVVILLEESSENETSNELTYIYKGKSKQVELQSPMQMFTQSE